MIKVPRLKINRHGVYCVRVYWRDASGKLRESLRSLNTKHGGVARLLALQWNLTYEQERQMSRESKKPPTRLEDLGPIRGLTPTSEAMASKIPDLTRSSDAPKPLPTVNHLGIHEYRIDISKGIYESEGEEDHRRMREAVSDAVQAFVAANGGQYPTLQSAMGYPKTPLALEVPPAYRISKSLKWSAATELYLAEKKLDNKPQTIVEKRRTYKTLMSAPEDLEINLIHKEFIVKWKQVDIDKGLSANRINKRLGQVNDFFNWAIHHNHYTAFPTSPVEGLFISNKSKLAAKTESYEPFSDDELIKIFDASYIKAMNKPDLYWIPIVSAFTGARREEIAGLLAKNVKVVDGVDCFLIEGGKTIDARRVVPIHPTLKALGFMDYAQKVQSLNEEYLFPHLVDGANGRGKNAGRQFAKWLETCGIKENRKVFHSFRHTVITRLQDFCNNDAHILQITGHRSEAAKGVHFKTYTHGLGLQRLAETMNQLHYPFSFDAIKTEPTFKTFFDKRSLDKARKARRAAVKARD